MMQRYIVDIAGVKIAIRAEEDESEVMSVAEAVNERINDITLGARYISKLEAALFACLDFFAEKRKLQKRLNDTNSQLSMLAAETNKLKYENEQLKKRLEGKK